MTLTELIADLKAAGANENTMRLAMNCYELGQKEQAVESSKRHLFTMKLAVDGSIRAERNACAALCEQMGIEGYGTLAIAAAMRARGQA